jgi:hypothetical protein
VARVQHSEYCLRLNLQEKYTIFSNGFLHFSCLLMVETVLTLCYTYSTLNFVYEILMILLSLLRYLSLHTLKSPQRLFGKRKMRRVFIVNLADY